MSPRSAASGARRFTVLTVLGFASGLPLALSDSTLQAWFAVAGIDIKTIGLLSLAGIPYLFKFFWAPLLDRYAFLTFGRRRGWLIATQIPLMAALAGFALLEPGIHLTQIAMLALLLAFLSASQDIVVDAYRAEVLAPAERGMGAGLSVAGYRLAMVVSGAGALFLADRVGFNAAYACMAGLMSIGLIGSLCAPEPAAPQAAPASLGEAFLAQLGRLLRREGIVFFLLLIVLYKLGDAFAGRLTMPFFIRAQGFSLTEIGVVYKALGIGASLVGGILGGVVMFKLRLHRALFWFAVLQAVTNLGFLALAAWGKSMLGMIVVVGLENLSGGMGTSALLALIMGLCERRYTATHFALLSAVASLARVFSGPVAGAVVAASGWLAYFWWSFVISLPVLALIIAMRTRIDQLDDA